MRGPDGVWLGLGLGDYDEEVAEFKSFLIRKCEWVRNWQPALIVNPAFDPTLEDIVKELQRRYGFLETGIVNYALKVKAGFVKRKVDVAKPVIFTVEGHLSSMWEGPCAFSAKKLEDEHVVRWQPVGYDNVSLPFRSQTGVDELDRLFSDTITFPLGTPFGMMIFSQGGIVGTRFFLEQIRPENGKHHNRLKDLKAVVAFGNPYREKNVIASWVPDPPRGNTQGISDVRMTNTPEFWREHSRTGDLYAENPDSEVGLDRTAVYKIVAESKIAGGQAGMMARLQDLIKDPFDGLWDIVQAIAGGVKFLVNMTPHGAYDLTPCIDFMRSRLSN